MLVYLHSECSAAVHMAVYLHGVNLNHTTPPQILVQLMTHILHFSTKQLISCGKETCGQQTGITAQLRTAWCKQQPSWCSQYNWPGCGLDEMGFKSCQCQEFFSLFHNFQTTSGAHSASYTMGNGGSFLGHKAAMA